MLKLDKHASYEEILYESALHYVSNGLYVLPLRKNEKLLPPSSKGVSYSSASRSRDKIREWFEPDTGSFAGCNIGIATGRHDGVFVVDQDAEEWEDLERLPECPIQLTPSGGYHFLFRWRDGAVNSTSKIGEGIDTRGGTYDDCKGHIVVWPSKTEAGQYKWKNPDFDSIPETPDWVMDRMGKAWNNPSRSGNRGNENIEDTDLEQMLEIPQIEAMLRSIDIDGITYDDWLHIGQAINSQYPGKDGLEIWEKWSRTGQRYKKGECYNRWNGFDPTGGMRSGTLFFHAMDHGWEPSKGDKKANKHDVLVETMNQKYAMVVVGGKVRVIRERISMDTTIDSKYELLGTNDFLSLTQNDVVFINNKPVSVGKIWMAHEGRRTFPDGMGLFPDGRTPEGKYNTWQGFNVMSAEGDCSKILDHIKTSLCRGNEDWYNWLMDWCADSVQDPSNPKGCAVVMRGDEGAGKGVLGNLMLDIFGCHGRHLIDDSHLLSNFNAHMMDALYIFADEITWGGNVKSAGKLKGMVTERYLIGERKGVDAVTYKNMSHILIASNNEWVVPASANSRRWFVLDVSNQRILDREYFDDIHDQLDNGGKEAFMHFLMKRKITNDLRRAPETEALKSQRMFGMSQDSTSEWWVEKLVSGTINVACMEKSEDLHNSKSKWPQRVMTKELFADYREWTKENNRRSDSIMVWVKRLLPVSGIKSSGQEMTIPSIEDSTKIASQTLNLDIKT